MQRQQSAFSLVELLLTIGIFAILVCLLFLAVKTVREGSEAAKCASNLRQVGMLLRAEAADNNGVIKMHSASGNGTTKRWNNYLIEGGYLSAEDKIGFCPSLARSAGVAATSANGYVYGTITVAQEGDPHSTTFDDLSNSRAIRLLTIERPSEYWLLTDSWSSLNSHQIYIIEKTSGSRFRMQLRHRGKANMLFADGHVGAVDLEDTRKLAVNPLVNAFDKDGKAVKTD